MTETDWLQCEDIQEMMGVLRDSASDRKQRLVAVGLCRQVSRSIKEKHHRRALEVAEDFADGRVSWSALAEARSLVWEAARGSKANNWAAQAVRAAVSETLGSALRHSQRLANEQLWRNLPHDPLRISDAKRRAQRLQCQLIREIIGSLCRPGIHDPSLLTPTVRGLALAAYDQRLPTTGELDNARLAVLSDAVEEAGCSEADLLGHLRDPGPHFRGCWALDLLLDRR